MTNQVFQQASTWRSRLVNSAQCIGLIGLITAGTSAIAHAQDSSEDAIEPIPSAQDLLNLPPAEPVASPIIVEPTAVPEAIAAPEEFITAPSAPVDANSYIDSSNEYNLGATTPVVLDERSTGCQTIVDGGYTGQNTCSVASAPSVPSRAAAAQLGDISSVSIGPVSINSRGVEWNPNFSIQNFLNITPRPIGRLGNGDVDLMFPLTIPAPISSLFGWRVHPIYGDTRLHTGTDIAAPMGTPIVAAFGGTVVTADFLQGYGITVVIEDQDGTQQTLYAHMSELFVEAGDDVNQGDVIGRVGSTGNSTGPHLHFEVREMTPTGWVALNPNEALEIALEHFSSDFQVAALAKSGKDNPVFSSLVQFGRFASKASLKDAAKPIPGMDTADTASKAADTLPVVQVNELSN
jgi:murein DD-endopeptidase MepM/ murein hydrolase activator NlpD